MFHTYDRIIVSLGIKEINNQFSFLDYFFPPSHLLFSLCLAFFIYISKLVNNLSVELLFSINHHLSSFSHSSF